MKTALIGLPQSGKKTLFSLLTGRPIPPGRKPGEAIEGRAFVRDSRVDALSAMYCPKRTVYAENRFSLCPDVAEGASAREWLDAARKCDLLCLVTRAFESDIVYHAAGSVDAARDAATVRTELLLADMARIEARLSRMAKEKRSGQTEAQALEERTLRRCMETLDANRFLLSLPLEPRELASIRSLELVTFIPMLVIRNVSDTDIGRSPREGEVVISARIEQEILELADLAEREEYLTSLGLAASGVDRVCAAAYEALGLISFYTVGEDEVRAWSVGRGSAAPEAGGKIHSDIQRGFIRVEVMKYDDLMAAGSEAAVKAQGKALLKGADYVIEDGDICHFLFNV